MHRSLASPFSGPGWRSASVDWPGGPGIPSESFTMKITWLSQWFSHGYHLKIYMEQRNSNFFQAVFLVGGKKPGPRPVQTWRWPCSRYRAPFPRIGLESIPWFQAFRLVFSNKLRHYCPVHGWWSPIEGVPLFSGKPSWFLRRASGLSAK